MKVRLSTFLDYRVGRFKSVRFKSLIYKLAKFGALSWFKSRFKSIDFFVKKIEWFKLHWRFHLPM